MNSKIEKKRKVKNVRSKSREDSAAEARSLSAAIIKYLLSSFEVKSTKLGEALGLSRYSIWKITKGDLSLRITDILILEKLTDMSIHKLIEVSKYKPKTLQSEYNVFKKALKSSPNSGRKRN